MALQSGGSDLPSDLKESIVAAALSIVNGGDLNTLTIRKVKELLKKQINVEESYDEQLTELVKVAIDRHITSLQQPDKIRSETSTKEVKQAKGKRKLAIKKEEISAPVDGNTYHRLTKVCRQLGLGLPINKLKGVEKKDEKIEIVKEYLRNKGVTKDPLLLTEKQLKSLRAKLEHEKELKSLDASNILQDSGKRKRAGMSLGSAVVDSPKSSTNSYSTDEGEEEKDINSSSQEEEGEVFGDSKSHSSKKHKILQDSDEESV
ncbi:hypothetical protein GpartN1_g1430.t1 [Galdieria partita]|uniref:Histone chaperone domain-containing protein n=1 Tax=Galdieria partita TaxID=83374 RepID=A0A9C7UN77_9RHOD|nr:hypothetical protein GpartN1_g1430.t1 [Galdieria partita]